MRPITELHVDVDSEGSLLSGLTPMQGLTSLRVGRASQQWLEGGAGASRLASAFPHLQRLDVWVRQTKGEWDEGEELEDEGDRAAAAAGLLCLFQAIAASPLQVLSLSSPQLAALDAAAMAQIARLHQLRELTLSALCQRGQPMVLEGSHLFAAWTAGCLSCLRGLTLESVLLTPESTLAVVSAAPRLRQFDLSWGISLSCHPAIICAIVAGCCAEIEKIYIDAGCCGEWGDVQAADITAAYAAALSATSRNMEYRPFSQLHQLHLKMCTCAPPSVWHALLRLLRTAEELRSVVHLSSDDPLSISALANLPSLSALDGSCEWPLSFPVFVHQVEGRTPPRTWLDIPPEKRCGCNSRGLCPSGGALLELSAGGLSSRSYSPSFLLRPDADLFAAYQRSLSADHQAVLARWAAGDFLADDGLIRALERPEQDCPNYHHPRCPHGHRFGKLLGDGADDSGCC